MPISKGPWKYIKYKSNAGKQEFFIENDEWGIGTVFIHNQDDPKEDEANARAIAAVPEMIEVLKEIKTRFKPLREFLSDTYLFLLFKAEAIIDHVEGGGT